MRMKNIISGVICLVIPLLVGVLSSVMTVDNMRAFETMNKPSFAPPAYLFPLAWTVLYVLMGIGTYIIVNSDSDGKFLALLFYAGQLTLNFFWSPVFFNLEEYWFAFIILILMLALIIALIIASSRISIAAMLCFVPLACWSAFAALLNISIARMN